MGKQPEDMLALPRMTNPQKLAAMRILMLATAPAYFEDQNLLPLLALRMVRLSARYGNAAHSAYGYVMYGLVHCGLLNDMSRGHTHGGQLCLPGSIPIKLEAVLPRRMGAGAWQYHNMSGYTSVGAGSSVIAVRLNCLPEIPLHCLRRG